MRTLLLVVVQGLFWAPPGLPVAHARSSSSTASARTEGPRRRSHHHREKRGDFSGHKATSLSEEPLARPSGNVHVIHRAIKREVRVNIYNADGSFNEAALAELDGAFQCRRTHEIRAVDPRLYEVLSHIYDRFGAGIVLTSGFRYQRNESSRHFHASAMDISIPGVSTRTLYEYASSLDRGGMGVGKYPRLGFVHVDFRAPGEPSYRWTDRSRSGSSRREKRPSHMWRGHASKPRS